MAPDTASPFGAALRLDAVDLIGRPGSHRSVERTVSAPERDPMGPAMQPVPGSDLHIEAELESVVEGVYAHGTAATRLVGECSRCLDPVEDEVAVRLDELFLFPEKVKRDELEDAVLLTDDAVDLGPLVRDGLAVEADDRPLCRPDCPGLCAQCGFRMEDDPDHHHEVIDDRFAALQGFFGEDGNGSDGAEGPSADGPRPADRA